MDQPERPKPDGGDDENDGNDQSGHHGGSGRARPTHNVSLSPEPTSPAEEVEAPRRKRRWADDTEEEEGRVSVPLPKAPPSKAPPSKAPPSKAPPSVPPALYAAAASSTPWAMPPPSMAPVGWGRAGSAAGGDLGPLVLQPEHFRPTPVISSIIEDAGITIDQAPVCFSPQWWRLPITEPGTWASWGSDGLPPLPSVPPALAHAVPADQYLIGYHGTDLNSAAAILRDGFLRPGPASDGWPGVVCMLGVAADRPSEITREGMLNVLGRFNRNNGKHACPIVVEIRCKAPKIKCDNNAQYFGAPGTVNKAYPLNAGWTIAHFPRDHKGSSWTVPSSLCKVSAVYCDLAYGM